jgi:hypothetical protein
MARRPSPTALLLLLHFSLLAVAHCRALESEPATDASTAETTTLTIADETTSPRNPADAAASAAGAAELAAPEEQHALLPLPSHLRHRHHPCRHGPFHSHLWWTRQHGNLFGDGHRFHHRRGGDAELVRNGEPRVEAEEVKPVAELDPDRPITLRGSNGEDGGGATAIKRWRMFGHGLRHHRHHHHHHEEDEEAREQETAGLKRFRHHHHDEEKEKKMRKLFHFLLHQHDEMRKSFHLHHTDEVSDDELEETVRRFRKAILRRRFGHHHHHHTENAEQAHGEQQKEGGVMSWVKGLMNRF